jgi:aminoglycoside phosphotransferase family enzyme
MTTTTPAVTAAHADRPDPATDAEIYETHTGVVVLLGDRAFKLKKPVVTDFLDFSTPERRERVCAREVELNTRMAPDSYLGVAHLQIPGRAAPEPIVVMRRYPDRERLRSIVLRGEPAEPHLAALAGSVARFHAGASRSETSDACATVPEVRRRWQDNLAELNGHTDAILPQDTVDEIGRLFTRYLDGRVELFADRIRAGRIVDGHGDLLADDVFCTADGPVPLDCLEFDDRLRFVDGVDDAAFLAMDLEFLGRPPPLPSPHSRPATRTAHAREHATGPRGNRRVRRQSARRAVGGGRRHPP